MRIRQIIAATFLCSLSFLCWIHSANSAENDVLSSHPASSTLALNDAVARTLSNNPELYQYRFRQQSLVAQRESRLLSPAIELGLEVENVAGTGNFSGVDSAETTLALSSVLELGGKVRSRVAVIDARTDRLGFERQAATLDVLGELTALYIRSLSTQESIRLAEEAVTLSERMVKTIERRTDRGAAPEAELMRAKAALIRASIQLQALQARFERQRVALSSFWSETNPRFTKLNGDLSSFEPLGDFERLYQRVKASPALAVFASEARLKDAQIKLAQAQSRVDIGWQLGVRRFEETDDTALTALVSIPLFNSKRNQGGVAQAFAERNAVDYQQADALIKLHTRLFTAYSQHKENMEAVEQMRSQVLPALEQALTLTQGAYEKGRYRYQDWIVAQEELLTAKQQHIEAATAAQLSQALIEQLTAEPLKTNNLTY